MIPTHVVTANGTIQIEVHELLGAERAVRRTVAILDGREDYSTSLWRLPSGKQLSDNLPVGWPYSYIQSAGSAERMSIELRVADGDHGVQYAVGHPTDDPSGQELVRIQWDDRTLLVFENEVFDAREAGDIYWHYYQHGAIPEGYFLRPLDV